MLCAWTDQLHVIIIYILPVIHTHIEQQNALNSLWAVDWAEFAGSCVALALAKWISHIDAIQPTTNGDTVHCSMYSLRTASTIKW